MNNITFQHLHIPIDDISGFSLAGVDTTFFRPVNYMLNKRVHLFFVNIDNFSITSGYRICRQWWLVQNWTDKWMERLTDGLK